MAGKSPRSRAYELMKKPCKIQFEQNTTLHAFSSQLRLQSIFALAIVRHSPSISEQPNDSATRTLSRVFNFLFSLVVFHVHQKAGVLA